MIFQKLNTEFTANSLDISSQNNPTITALTDGRFVVVWHTGDSSQDGSGTAIKAHIYRFDEGTADWVTDGDEILVNHLATDHQLMPTVTALAGGGFVVTWETQDITQDGSGTAIKARIFDADGDPVVDPAPAEDGEFLVNTVPDYGQEDPVVASLAGGGFVVAWDGHDGEIRLQIFGALGAPHGSGELVANTVTIYQQRDPAITGLDDGRFVVTWYSYGSTDATDGIKAQIFNPDGTRDGGEFEVDVVAAFQAWDPAITDLPGGGFVVAWMATGSIFTSSPDGSGQAIMAQIYDEDDNRVGDAFVVNTESWGVQRDPAITSLPDGRFIVTWTTAYDLEDHDGAIKAQIFAADGSRQGEEFLVNTVTAGAQVYPAIASLPSGEIVAVWQNAGSISAQIWEPFDGTIDGVTLSNTEVSETTSNNLVVGELSPEGGLVGSDHSYVILSDSTGGAFGIVGDKLIVADNSLLDHETATTATLTVEISDHLANTATDTLTLEITDAEREARYTAGDEFVVNTEVAENLQDDPVVAGLTGGPLDGGFVVAWKDYTLTPGGPASPIRAQRHDADGTPVGDEIVVNTAGTAVFPEVTGLDNGGFVVTWVANVLTGGVSSREVFARVFDENGDPRDVEFQVNTGTLWTQDLPTVTALGGGRFVVTWETGDPAQDGSGSAIMARVFDATGAAITGETQINTVTLGHQKEPTIDALPAGGFVVTWQGAGDPTIRAQVFDDTGIAVGGEISVNTETYNAQILPTVAGLAEGRFVVAWMTHDPTQDGSYYAIKAQIFELQGGAWGTVGAEFLVNTEGFHHQELQAITSLADGGFVVTWQTDDPAQDGSMNAIKAQIFNADGDKVGDEFLVNEATAYNQNEPAIAGLAGGGFVATWWTDDYNQDGNRSAIMARVFTPTNAPPVLVDPGALTFPENSTDVIVDLMSTDDSDAEGTGLTYALAGSVDDALFLIDPDTGELTFAAPPDFETPLDQGGDNTYDVEVTVSDSLGATDIRTLAIDVTDVNEPPEAADDSATTDEDTPVNIAVLGNDGDVDGDSLTVASVGVVANGGVVIEPDGTLTYTPDTDFHGTDSFSYEVSDGNGGTDTATVTVTVDPVNDAPVATPDAPVGDEDTVIPGLVTATDVDGDVVTFAKASDPANGAVTVNPDGTYAYTANPDYFGSDSFEVTADDGNGGTHTVTVPVTVEPVNDAPVAVPDAPVGDEDTVIPGLVTATDVDGDVVTFAKAADPANGAVTVNPDGTYAYTPNPDYFGSDSFEVIADDGNGGTHTVTVPVTVDPVNDAPVAVPDAPVGDEDTVILGLVTATDVDGDVVTFAKASDPASGAVTVNPDGTYAYTPNPDYFGSDSFEVTADDGNGGTHTVTVPVTVEPVNDAPVATDDSATTDEDTPVNIAVLGNDSDVDGDSLTVASVGAGANGGVVIEPDGTLTYTPDTDFHGTDSFSYEVSDGNGGTDTATVTVTVEEAGGPDYVELFGTWRNDWLFGKNAQMDAIFGMAGKDRIFGLSGDDLLDGGLGNDRLYGGAGDDLMYGGPGNDMLNGGTGDDLLHGGPGNDWLFGRAGDDILRDGPGNDWMYGGRGDDVFLFEGGGIDLVSGGSGADSFVFEDTVLENGEADLVKVLDYRAGVDVVDIGDADVTSVREFNNRVELTLGADSDTLILKGIDNFDEITFAEDGFFA